MTCKTCGKTATEFLMVMVATHDDAEYRTGHYCADHADPHNLVPEGWYITDADSIESA